jgi:hypothetical protein
MARESITADTGREVRTVVCPRKVDLQTGDRLECHVVFADGFEYESTASITMRPGPGIRDYIDARFSLPPTVVPKEPAASGAASPSSGHGLDANAVQECLSDASSDAAKRQACLSGIHP